MLCMNGPNIFLHNLTHGTEYPSEFLEVITGSTFSARSGLGIGREGRFMQTCCLLAECIRFLSKHEDGWARRCATMMARDDSSTTIATAISTIVVNNQRGPYVSPGC